MALLSFLKYDILYKYKYRLEELPLCINFFLP